MSLEKNWVEFASDTQIFLCPIWNVHFKKNVQCMINSADSINTADSITLTIMWLSYFNEAVFQ